MEEVKATLLKDEMVLSNAERKQPRRFQFRKLGLRLMNRGTLLALVAFLVKQGLAYGYIPTQEVADSIVTLADWATTGLIALGVLNNASVGKGFSDAPNEQITFHVLEDSSKG